MNSYRIVFTILNGGVNDVLFGNSPYEHFKRIMLVLRYLLSLLPLRL